MKMKLRFVPLVALSAISLTGCDSQAIADALKPITDAIEEINKPDSGEGATNPDPKPPVLENVDPPASFRFIGMVGTPEKSDGMSYLFKWGDAAGDSLEPVTYEICAREESFDTMHCDSLGSFVDLKAATVKLPYVPAIGSTTFYVKAERGGKTVLSNEYTYTVGDFQAQVLKVKGNNVDFSTVETGPIIGKPQEGAIVYTTEGDIEQPKTLEIMTYDPSGESGNKFLQRISVSDLSSVGIDETFYFNPPSGEAGFKKIGTKDSILVMLPIYKDGGRKGHVALVSDNEGEFKPLKYFSDVHFYETYRDGRLLTYRVTEKVSRNRYQTIMYVYLLHKGMDSIGTRGYELRRPNGSVSHVSDDESLVVIYFDNKHELYRLTDTSLEFIEDLGSGQKLFLDKAYYSYKVESNTLSLTNWFFDDAGATKGNSINIYDLPDNYGAPIAPSVKRSEDGEFLMFEGAHRMPPPDVEGGVGILPYIKVPVNADLSFKNEEEIRVYAFDTRVERSRYDLLFAFGRVAMSADQQHLIAHDGEYNYYIGNGEPLFGIPIEEESGER